MRWHPIAESTPGEFHSESLTEPDASLSLPALELLQTAPKAKRSSTRLKLSPTLHIGEGSVLGLKGIS
jgi:hypothetical protein